MSRFTSINLADLPPPPVVEALDYETILAEMRAGVIAAAPQLAEVLALESEPVNKVLEVAAYREVLLRQRVNDAARAVMLAHATGGDLDNLAAIFGVARLVLDPGDPQVIPPVPPVLETDAAFRARVQLALEGPSTAGPEGAYLFWALQTASAKDASVASPAPGEVVVTVLDRDGDGTALPATLSAVDAVLNDQDIRPLTDQVTVQGATILTYAVEADLTLYDGPDSGVVIAAAEAAVAAFVEDQHRLGRDITLSGLYAALHRPGVQRVALIQPAADIVVASDEAAWCTGVTVSFGGRDE
jgi:phage-related baseplate assembly protein